MRPAYNVIVFLALVALLSATQSNAQGNLYTARGYWEELNKANYREIKLKLERGDSLTVSERNYVQDYEAYLNTYFTRLSQEDKDDFARLKPLWDSQLAAKKTGDSESNEFQWRTGDRIKNGFYGLWYGITLTQVFDISGTGSAAVPFITTGLWLAGPLINPRKYEHITRSTVRANNSGKFLGLLYGGSLGLAVGGNSDNSGKWILGLSTVGSIALGEIAFYGQQSRNYSVGHIEMMRHYGVLGPLVGLSAVLASGSSNANLAGAAMVGGGVAGLMIGNAAARKYDYTWGDVDAISSLTIIATGLGFSAITGIVDNTDTRSLLLVPAISAIAATKLGQKAVRGARLSDKQGSTLNLSSAGAALVGLGIVSLFEPSSSTVWLAVPSGLALITHQILFHKYKTENIQSGFQGRRGGVHRMALHITPESYFLNQHLPVKDYSPQTYARLQNPLVRLVWKF